MTMLDGRIPGALSPEDGPPVVERETGQDAATMDHAELTVAARVSDPHGDTVREAAVRAAELGHQLVALHGVLHDGRCTCQKGANCPAPGKHPRGRNWQEGLGTLARFRQYTDGAPALNLGLRLDADAPTPLVLLDVDTKHGKPGAASLAQLVADAGPLPEGALLQTTPSGGQHYLLRLPEGVDPSALPTGTELLPGLDVFTHHRQFVVSPSRTAAGAYTFADAARGLPAPLALPVLPAQWADRLQKLVAVNRAAPAGTATTDPPDVAPDANLVVQLLELLPAPAENTRDECVDFAYAIHGALANAELEVLTAVESAFLRWAGRWPGAVPEHDQHIWDTTLGAKHRGWRRVLIDAQRFLDYARAAATLEDAGISDGASVDAAQDLLETIRQSEAQTAFPVLEPIPSVTSGPSSTPIGLDSKALVKSFAEVQPRRIEWLLEGRVARQQITMINGWPGEGKTSVVIDIVARMTKGEGLPDGTVPPGPLRALFLSTEDSESILRLRLQAAGADLDRVFTIPDTELERLTLPSKTEAWVQLLKEQAIDVVVVDPMKSFLDDGLKDIAEQDARKFMRALRQIAEVREVAAICIRHPNKATAAGHSTAISAASGSLGFTAAARIELLVGRLPNDEETRALVHVKNNLAKPPAALLYRIVSRDVSFDEGLWTQDVASIEWKGVDDKLLADDLLARRESREQRSKLDEAKAFLMSHLASGPLEHSGVRAAAKAHGIAARTLERARDEIGWYHFVGNPGAGAKSIWGLEGQSVGDFKESSAAKPNAQTHRRLNGGGKANSKGTKRAKPETGSQQDEALIEEPLLPADLSDVEGTNAGDAE